MEVTKAAEPTRITATELARNLSDILNRVRYKRESFRVERNGEVVAKLIPSALDAKGPAVHTVGEFIDKFGDRTVPEGIADAIEDGRRALKWMPEPPYWP